METKTISIYKFEELKPKIQEKVLNEFREEEDFKSIYEDICGELEKEGYSIIEDALKDDAIKEQIEMNEYAFRENGEIEFI